MRLHPIHTLLALAVGLVLLLSVALESPSALAQLPWPTPPPAPIGSFPEVVPSFLVTPVAAPASSSSIVQQVDPIFAGPVPRIPPRPSVQVLSGEPDPQERVTIDFDAGVLSRTVQVSYEPIGSGAAPEAPSGQTLLRVFSVNMYDAEGNAIEPVFKYPVRMVLKPKPEYLAASGNDAARLLVARYDSNGNRWQPLVTNYDPINEKLLVRILQPGLFALLANPAPMG